MSQNATGASSSPPAVRCAGPGDALDAIPWVLGFHPTESLVMICLQGPRARFGPVLRFDLPDPDRDASLISEAVRLFTTTTCEQVLLVVYTDAGSSDPLAQLPRQDLLLEARKQFTRVEGVIKDAVIVRHGRWFSLLCDDPLCCAPEGTVVAHDSPSAVDLTYLAAGAKPPLPSRDAVAEGLVARPDPAVSADLQRLTSQAGGLDVASLLDQLEEIYGYVMAHRGAPLDPAVTAMLIYLAQVIPCRDAAADLPSSDELDDAVDLWREVYVATPEDCRAHVGSILAVLAWEAGGGALARSVCESVLRGDPTHRLTLLTLRLIHNHIRPQPRPTRAEADRAARSALRTLQRHKRMPTRGSRGNGGGQRLKRVD